MSAMRPMSFDVLLCWCGALALAPMEALRNE